MANQDGGLQFQGPGNLNRQDLRSGNAKTFPFVLEYPTPGEKRILASGSSEYPSEIRFHQYEGFPERRPISRNRKDSEQGGAKQRRRTQQVASKPDLRKASPPPILNIPTHQHAKAPQTQTAGHEAPER